MAQNQTADWFPAPTGNHQYDENQRRIWESLYYLRGQANNASQPQASAAKGMSGTIFFTGGFTVGSGVGAKIYNNMTFKDGILVAIS